MVVHVCAATLADAAKATKADAARKKKPTDWAGWRFPIRNDKELEEYFRLAAVPSRGRGGIFIHEYKVQDNVLGFWPADAKWYQAQVYEHHGYDRYSLYFPEDDTTYVGAPKCHINKPPGDKLWARHKRSEYHSKKFQHKKQQPGTPSKLGLYTVLEGDYDKKTGRTTNKYMCEHCETKVQYTFSMGYVQKLLLKTLTGEWRGV